MNENIKKYSMKTNTEIPSFNYLVRSNDDMDYYLFFEFDDALNKLKTLSLENRGHIACLFETFFNTTTREWHGQNTFTAYDGIIEYDKHAKVELHLEFYINAGEWLNPDIKLGK